MSLTVRSVEFIESAAAHNDSLVALRTGPAAEIIKAAVQAHITQTPNVLDAKAVLRAGLAAAAAAHGLNLGIKGPQKLALVQSLVKDALQALPDDVKAPLEAVVDASLPAAVDGLLFALKTAAAAPSEANGSAAAVSTLGLLTVCLPLLCGGATPVEAPVDAPARP